MIENQQQGAEYVKYICGIGDRVTLPIRLESELRSKLGFVAMKELSAVLYSLSGRIVELEKRISEMEESIRNREKGIV